MYSNHQYSSSQLGLVSIVLPCYNEELAVEKVINDVRAVMEQITDYQYELIVVDDCSTDRTVEIVEGIADVRLIRHRQNQGSGASRRSGIIGAKGEIIVMLDADGTYEPKTIPKMLKYFPDYDQVNGARDSEKGTMPLLRTPAKWILRHIAMFIAGHHIPDLNTGLKAFKRDVMLKYLWVMPDGFSCVTSMTLAYLANGHPVKYVKTPYYKRIGVSKFHPIVDSSKYFVTILRMMTFFRPLRVYMPIAGIMILLGILNGLYNVFIRPTHTLQESDIILICVGTLVGGIGLLAELLVSQRKA
ncbi:MAG: glycosyltransferase family 2 protein [Sumerlaeia bacterium]